MPNEFVSRHLFTLYDVEPLLTDIWVILIQKIAIDGQSVKTKRKKNKGKKERTKER